MENTLLKFVLSILDTFCVLLLIYDALLRRTVWKDINVLRFYESKD